MLLDLAAAIVAGDKFYTTGKPCKRGHPSRRYVSSGCCKACLQVTHANPTTRNKNRLRERQRRADTPELVRESTRLAVRKHAQLHPKRRLAYTRAYQAAKLQRTPLWADLLAIRTFYEACPDGMEVDHIHPLRGKYVSGLHVLNNLQYLSATDNRAKGNR